MLDNYTLNTLLTAIISLLAFLLLLNIKLELKVEKKPKAQDGNEAKQKLENLSDICSRKPEFSFSSTFFPPYK